MAVKEEVENTIKNNLKNIVQTLEIFNKYSYIVKEKERAEVWIQQTRTRAEYNEEFNKYRKMYDEIFE